MSWQAYIDTSMIGTGHIDKGAIFSVDGTSVWATSPGFSLKPQELQEIVSSFKDTSNPKKIQMNGLHIAGQKYLVLQAGDSSIYAKQGKSGIVVVKTKQALLIAHYPETVQPGNATNAVEKLGDYLKGVGY